MITEREFDALAAKTLERVLDAFDEVDPDVVEAVPSDGVVRLEFQGKRQTWIVNTQRGALQVWLAAERKAWHFAHAGESTAEARWISAKTGEELFATLASLLKEHAGLDVSF